MLLGLALTVVAAVRLYVPAWNASDLNLLPDAVGYAVPAERWVSLGSYSIAIEGKSYPTDGASWFPALLIAPTYALFGTELGNAIYPVLACALVALIAAFALSRRIGGAWAGVLAAALILIHPKFERWSREVMTDIPALAFGLAAAWLYVRKPRERNVRDDALAGLIAGLGFAMRSTELALLAPFAWSLVRQRGQRPVVRALVLLAPCAIVFTASAIYDSIRVGQWDRSGYQLWHAVPMDYPELVFGSEFVQRNLEIFVDPWCWAPLAAALLAAGAFLVTKQVAGRAWLEFTLLAALPISVFHLFYFFPAVRFHLLLIALACAGACAAFACALPRPIRDRGWLALPLALVPLAWPPPPAAPTPHRRIIADALREHTPDDAIVISSIDPVYLDPLLLRGSHRRVIAANREVAFAGQLVAWRRVPHPDPPVRDGRDRRCAGLKRGGAREVEDFTVDERPEQIADWVRAGKPVFVDASLDAKTHTLALLRRNGLFAERATTELDWLVRLHAH